jgi:PEP-CTERM motif-containing protein
MYNYGRLTIAAVILQAVSVFATTSGEVSAYSTIDALGHYDDSLAVAINRSLTYGYQDVGNSFVPTVSGVVSSIEVGITVYVPLNGPLNLRLASNASGNLPAATSLLSGSVANGPIPQPPWSLATFSPSTPVSITAGTTYWLVMSPTAENTEAGWYFNSAGINGRTTYRNAPIAPWSVTPNGSLSAFRVNVLVPEPSSLALGAMALGVLVFRYRSGRKA